MGFDPRLTLIFIWNQLWVNSIGLISIRINGPGLLPIFWKIYPDYGLNENFANFYPDPDPGSKGIFRVLLSPELERSGFDC